ncbi:YbaN family protein [Corynebacterium diphtheriae]|uniref:YbaN family protein n=1 Tax=Corynebacterium diphtheriae TaxID=1717 RepID=UPI00038F7EE0|nr:YbaN family protein [Corynebacterium diphtheriae]ERA51218.1 iron-regulated membrane protein [Corynebacterium diphtheriae str. Aberdeen]KLN37219.1 membrane protein [Corynebacterium diphtheriae bv. gravis str. ISS 4746]KLN43107.1 membrane protein [Corynebacterium diphtheriae bv. gravis str. ISS 4749]MBG9368859.1 YbaN family protein [Corynebacterium diphtheriae bv. gravis]MBG9379806.1 YbaN family protein [Corynebacterium diphtheriae bv. gravis]
MIKPLLLAIGCVSVTLGVAGVILPLVPTTPFLLLAGVCFAKSSDRFHTWLMEHHILGPYIHNWRNRQMTSKDKVRTVAAIWVSMLSSAAITYVTLETIIPAIVLPLMACVATLHISRINPAMVEE